jgi:hypothetical protein
MKSRHFLFAFYNYVLIDVVAMKHIFNNNNKINKLQVLPLLLSPEDDPYPGSYPGPLSETANSGEE